MNKFLWKVDPNEETCTGYLSDILSYKIRDPHFKPECQHSDTDPTKTILTRKVYDTVIFQTLLKG